MKHGTLTKKNKPTRLSVELFLKYFELGGRPTDTKINPLIGERIQEMMGWKNGEGIVCLHWGLHPNAKNSKKHEYYIPMTVAKDIAWDIFNKCSK
jgi:hypothetical protein